MTVTTVVLGAGSSLCNAEHFHQKRMTKKNPPLDSTFFAKLEELSLPIPPSLREYAADQASVDPFDRGAAPVRMEEFFKELFADFQDAPASSTSLEARAYADLLELYVRALRDTTNWMCNDSRTGGPVGRFLNHVADGDELHVITFNHDLVIENELFKRARLRGRWCIEQGYAGFNGKPSVTKPTGRRSLLPSHTAACDHSRPIRIYKLHGSLNWYVRLRSERPTANFLSGRSGGASALSITRRRTIDVQFTSTTAGRNGGRTKWYTWPVVIPPVHEKDTLIRRFLPDVWSDARAALQSSDRVVFFGYSLPVLDVGAERLFQRQIASSSRLRYIEVIDPSPSVAYRYAALTPSVPLHWYPTLETFLDAAT